MPRSPPCWSRCAASASFLPDPVSRDVYLAEAFGIVWCADLPLPGFAPIAPDCARRTRLPVVRVEAGAPAERPVLRPNRRGAIHADGISLWWQDIAHFDMWDGDRVIYTPGPGWTGTMPAAFYSTIAALLLAWRGAVPLHASAVVVGGAAVLIAGAAGAGKSTSVAAALIAGGALVSDDLSCLDFAPGNDAAYLKRGRPAIRLHPQSAALLPGHPAMPAPGDPRGKWLVEPAFCPDAIVRLGGVILLGAPEGPLAAIEAAAHIRGMLFRPRWMAALPGQRARLMALLALPGVVRFAGMAPLTAFDSEGLAARAAALAAFAQG